MNIKGLKLALQTITRKKPAEMSLCLKFVFVGVQMRNASVVVKLSMAQVQNKDQRRGHK